VCRFLCGQIFTYFGYILRKSISRLHGKNIFSFEKVHLILWETSKLEKVHLILWETSKLYSKVSVLFFFSTSNKWDFCCFTSLPEFGVISVLNKCVKVSHCLSFHFVYDIWCRASFHMLNNISISSLVRCVC